MQNVMIDFETLGNCPNAAVIQIGACYFNELTGEISEVFKKNIDFDDAIESGGKVNGNTIKWWLNQDQAARDSILDKPFFSTIGAFCELNHFLKEADRIWSHATFDFVILSNTLNRLKIKPCFSYWQARDIRTLMDLAQINPKLYQKNGVAHDALDDCINQVKYCVDALNKIGFSK